MEMVAPSSKKLGKSVSASEATPLFSHDSRSAQDHEALPPLVAHRTPLRQAPAWQFWSTLSTTHRFYLLLLMSCIPFGGHFVKVRLHVSLSYVSLSVDMKR